MSPRESMGALQRFPYAALIRFYSGVFFMVLSKQGIKRVFVAPIPGERRRCHLKSQQRPLGCHGASLTELGVKGGRLAHDVRSLFLHRVRRLVQSLVLSPNQLKLKKRERSQFSSISLWG